MSGSLGQVRMLSLTPAIVMFSLFDEVKLKLTALYIAACSVNGSSRTKHEKFSGYMQRSTPPTHVGDGGPPL